MAKTQKQKIADAIHAHHVAMGKKGAAAHKSFNFDDPEFARKAGGWKGARAFDVDSGLARRAQLASAVAKAAKMREKRIAIVTAFGGTVSGKAKPFGDLPPEVKKAAIALRGIDGFRVTF